VPVKENCSGAVEGMNVTPGFEKLLNVGKTNSIQFQPAAH